MDPELKYGLLGYLSTGIVPENINKLVQKMVEKVADHYTINKNERYKINKAANQQVTYQKVINTHERIQLLRKVHDEPLGGHLGQENTYNRVQQSYYWPGMKKDIIEYVKTCKTCQKRERRRGEAPLKPIKKTITPFYQVGIDVMGPLPITMTGKRYIVVAVDHFTKWIEARALEEADAQSIISFIYDDVICRHGIPQILSSDRGTEFINELIAALTKKYHIHHIKTTAYHPQGNGQVERINRIIKDILAKITPKNGDWSHYLASALFATRVTKSASTKFTPAELLYGRPIRQSFESDDFDIEEIQPEEFAQVELNRIQNIRQQAGKFIDKAQTRQKKSHDDRVHVLEPLQIGDLVLVFRNMIESNWSAKLERKWEGPYRIQDIKEGSYRLKSLQNTILPNYYHRDRLKKYNDRKQTIRGQVLPRPHVEIPIRRSPSGVPQWDSSHH